MTGCSTTPEKAHCRGQGAQKISFLCKRLLSFSFISRKLIFDRGLALRTDDFFSSIIFHLHSPVLPAPFSFRTPPCLLPAKTLIPSAIKIFLDASFQLLFFCFKKINTPTGGILQASPASPLRARSNYGLCHNGDGRRKM